MCFKISRSSSVSRLVTIDSTSRNSNKTYFESVQCNVHCGITALLEEIEIGDMSPGYSSDIERYVHKWPKRVKGKYAQGLKKDNHSLVFI